MTTLLVASTGGHLAELHDLLPRLGVQDDCVWATFDSPQSRSLLDGHEVIHVPPATTRDPVGALRDLLAARRVLCGGRFRRVISTGASVAMSFFLPAARHGLDCHYIESATRTEGPSLTGRLVARVPRTRLYTQYPGWADGRWRYGGSIFDGYLPAPATPRPVARIVVTLGTQDRFGFPRLLQRLVDVVPPEAEVLWQVGSTRIPRMPAGARRQVPHAEMQQAMREADVIVTHAGVGSALAAMRAGRRAVYVPRRARHGEHVDDHQVEMARELDRRGLVLAREADAVTADDLARAASWTVTTTGTVPPFRWEQPA
ncbi:glycosyltransferase [Micromonospora matsumotoense]|uniref:glycosyltransferase n=1 Tax=Micromonospora matsumotoense TaxID=121616 RepID=UPI003410AFBD